MSRLISKMSTMKKETNKKVEFITFYKFFVTEEYQMLCARDELMRKQGLSEGRIEERKELIANALKKLQAEDVSEILGVPLESVREIQKEMNKK